MRYSLKFSSALRAQFYSCDIAFSKIVRAHMYADGNMRINCERPKDLDEATVVSHLSRHVDLSENVNFSSEGVDLSGVST